jgi:hypothetical protein
MMETEVNYIQGVILGLVMRFTSHLQSVPSTARSVSVMLTSTAVARTPNVSAKPRSARQRTVSECSSSWELRRCAGWLIVDRLPYPADGGK